MKTLVFSDTHLTGKFDESKFIFLRKIIDSSDQVIINGDFWDAWFTSFDNFVASKWSRLFPLLLKKKAIYLHGNHDPADKCDTRVDLFSVETRESYELVTPTQTYRIEHGHRIQADNGLFLLDVYFSLLEKVDRLFFKKVIHYFLHFLEYLGYLFMGISFITKSRVAKKRNETIKMTNQRKKYLICGDTHCAELDRKSPFANSGCIYYGSASFLMISDDEIYLHKGIY